MARKFGGEVAQTLAGTGSRSSELAEMRRRWHRLMWRGRNLASHGAAGNEFRSIRNPVRPVPAECSTTSASTLRTSPELAPRRAQHRSPAPARHHVKAPRSMRVRVCRLGVGEAGAGAHGGGGIAVGAVTGAVAGGALARALAFWVSPMRPMS